MALTYKKRYELLLEACQTALEDCEMALDGSWDKSDGGFEDQQQMLIEAIETATGKEYYGRD